MRAVIAAFAGALALATTGGAAAASAAPAAEQTLGAAVQPPLQAKPAIVGGVQQTIQQVPWQVFVEAAVSAEEAYDCGGSVYDDRHVITAAHCVINPRTLQRFPERDITVIAGASSIPTAERTVQRRAVESFRVHPFYAPVVGGVSPDDVAVIRLAAPLDLSGAAVRAIPLISGTLHPAPGTGALISGFGRQSRGGTPDGKLYALGTSIGDPLACGAAANATVLCIASPSGSACEGDSGGPLVIGTVLAGVASFVSTNGPAGECGVGSVNGYTNLAAPEIALFVQGSDAPPPAPRGGSDISARGVFQARSAMTCAPGTWSGDPAFSFAFVDTSSGQLLQAGPNAGYTLLDTDAGRTIACQVSAANAGGVTIARTQSSPPIAVAPAPPTDAEPTPRATPKPSLRLSVTASRSRAAAGASVQQTIHVANRGRAAAKGVIVCAAPGRSLSFAKLQRGGAKSRGRACWKLGTIRARTTRTVQLTVRLARGANPGRTATTVTLRSANAGRSTLAAPLRVVR
ncbi:MAG TPA: serine protease [Conexibacter sp.]|nr:serine protease [Conexibacter sp.]